MKKLFFGLALTFTLVLVACAPVATDGGEGGAEEATETVKIGFIMPLTGDVASLGQDDKTVVEMFFEENPVIGGKKVEVIYEDGQCSGQHAASAAQKLINVDGVKLILGGGCSGETLGIAPIADKNKVLTYTVLSTSPEVSGVSRYVFRGAPSDDASSDVMRDLLKDTYKKVALITQNNDYSQAFRANLQEKLPAAGMEIVVDEAFNSGTTDFKSILQKVKDSGADVLINLPGESGPGGFINKQARELGIELPVFSADILSGVEFFDVAKDTAEGTTIVIVAADKSRSDVSEFLEKFTERKGGEANAEAYVLLSWDRLNIIKNAIEEVGYDVEALVDYLENMDAYDGLGGVTEFDDNHDANIAPNVMVAKDGKFVIKK